jgi:hypothetical protein
MSSVSQLRKSWLARNKIVFIVGVPLLCFALAPFPLGCGMIFPIRDSLRGHPEGPHGAQPGKFVGLWIRDETVMHDFVGQALYLMPDGRFAGMPGMTVRRWHFDNGRLFIDSVSRCGNCYQGNVTTEHTIKFVGADQLFVTNGNKNAKRGVAGKYRRVEITGSLESELSRLKESTDEGVIFKAHTVERVIGHFENLSKSHL